MARLLIAAAAFAWSSAGHAQDEPPPVRWPTLVQSAKDAAGFAPRGWVVEASRTGDVDGDGIADLVAILHQRDPANVLHDQAMPSEGLDTNPRLLVVAKGQRGGPYRILLANRTLISRWIYGNQDDPLGDLDRFAIRRGSFTVPLHLFANAGGWSMFERTFAFCVVAGRCVLIGYDETYTRRNTGEITITSVDYLTSKRTVTNEMADDSTPPKTRRSRLASRRLLTIDQVGDGMEFAVK